AQFPLFLPAALFGCLAIYSVYILRTTSRGQDYRALSPLSYAQAARGGPTPNPELQLRRDSPVSSTTSAHRIPPASHWMGPMLCTDRKSTRLNSSHVASSYAV